MDETTDLRTNNLESEGYMSTNKFKQNKMLTMVAIIYFLSNFLDLVFLFIEIKGKPILFLQLLVFAYTLVKILHFSISLLVFVKYWKSDFEGQEKLRLITIIFLIIVLNVSFFIIILFFFNKIEILIIEIMILILSFIHFLCSLPLMKLYFSKREDVLMFNQH